MHKDEKCTDGAFCNRKLGMSFIPSFHFKEG